MEKRMGVILLMLAVIPCLYAAAPRFAYTNLLIDCGATEQSNATANGLVQWQTDGSFTKTGGIEFTSTNTNLHQMNTLRSFPKGHKNCYNLPLSVYRKFLFRAGFYYGNYDFLLRPPSFQLEIDGHFWANVTASTDNEPIYYELFYIVKREITKVCLVREKDGGTPFISSLEATEQLTYSYKFMDNNTALLLHSRINYGANKSVE